MQCLIIAAGEGQRLRQKGESKPLTPLMGIALIKRVIQTAREAGADDFYVVTGYRNDLVEAYLKQLANRLGIQITTILNENWQKKNGLSVLKARNHLHDTFLLLMTDHIFDPSIAQALVSYPLEKGEISLAVDGDILNHRIDIEDVTKVKVKHGRVHSIGKGLKEFNGFDTGIFLCTPAIFDALARCKKKNGDASLTDGVRMLAADKKARAIDVKGRFWIDVDDPIAFWRAENALTERSLKSQL